MSGWRKHFKTAHKEVQIGPISGDASKYSNWKSSLPEIYVGHPNRIERYGQMEQMDADSEVCAALDILAEFCTQMNESNHTAFELYFKETPTDNEIKIIKEQLVEWNTINDFNRRMFKIMRNVLKYGDQVMIRDPETFKLLWTEMNKVTKVIVNESAGKEPEQYFIKDLSPNLMNLSATAITASDTYTANPQTTGGGSYIQPNQPYTGGGRFSHQTNEVAVNADHIVHCSLTEGLDAFWPFGTSILENIFKVYKQKELLEDSIIIYRIQRAPERRVFKIDVGNMPTHMAMAFVERVKNEIHQRRIPSNTGGSNSSVVDTTYAPIGQNEDFFFPVGVDNRGSSVEVLPGGCLSMDTKIPLMDGRILTLAEMTAEYNNGKENWIYSCDPLNGNIVPGVVSWAGVTQQSAIVLKISLDNGETIIATPDHKFPILGKGKVEAKDLIVGERMIPFKIAIMIKAIEYLTDNIEVGTLTIDVDEKYHNYHTFALESGIFTYNSNLGEIDDLKFFTNKLFRGLRIPSSYLPTGADDSQSTFNDGKATTALIQEWRFNQYCKRLQSRVATTFDHEFKMFMRWRGITIDNGIFEIKFTEPQNFAKYRQAELDTTNISAFTQLEATPYLSKRFLLKRYLGLSLEEMLENETLWNEEQAADGSEVDANTADLRSVGVTPGGISGDLGNIDDLSSEPDMDMSADLDAGAPPTPSGPPTEGAPAP